jgi:hypothetical protein
MRTSTPSQPKAASLQPLASSRRAQRVRRSTLRSLSPHSAWATSPTRSIHTLSPSLALSLTRAPTSATSDPSTAHRTPHPYTWQVSITTLLVQLLSTGSDKARENATAALEFLVEQNGMSQADIATASPVPDLIGLLKHGIAGAKKFALWSLSLSIDAASQKILLVRMRPPARTAADATPPPPLPPSDPPLDPPPASLSPDSLPPVSLLCTLPMSHPCSTLSLSLSSLSLCSQEEDAVLPLVSELHSLLALTRQQAAAAVARLANNNNKTSLAIAKSGGIGPLIHIVRGGGPRELMGTTDGADAFAPTDAPAGAMSISRPASPIDAAAPLAAPPVAVSKAAPDVPPRPPTPIPDGVTEADLLDGMEARYHAAAALADLANVNKVGQQIVDLGACGPLVGACSDRPRLTWLDLARRLCLKCPCLNEA